jgi:hypothetical protein
MDHTMSTQSTTTAAVTTAATNAAAAAARLEAAITPIIQKSCDAQAAQIVLAIGEQFKQVSETMGEFATSTVNNQKIIADSCITTQEFIVGLDSRIAALERATRVQEWLKRLNQIEARLEFIHAALVKQNAATTATTTTTTTTAPIHPHTIDHSDAVPVTNESEMDLLDQLVDW